MMIMMKFDRTDHFLAGFIEGSTQVDIAVIVSMWTGWSAGVLWVTHQLLGGRRTVSWYLQRYTVVVWDRVPMTTTTK